VSGVEGAQPNDGRLCVKGRYGYDFIYSEERLKTPLIRENDHFREASWDEALNLVVKRFREIIAKHGPDAIGGVSCARSINEDSYQMQKLFRAVIGTNNIDNCARTCHAPSVAGLAMSFGSGAMTNSIQDFGKAKLIFVIGSNMTEAHPVVATYVKNAAAKGAELYVADPRRNGLARIANLHLPIRVGSDIAFLNALMNVLITEDLYDKNYVESCCTGFDELKAKVPGVSARAVGPHLRHRPGHDSARGQAHGGRSSRNACLHPGRHRAHVRRAQRDLHRQSPDGARQRGLRVRRRQRPQGTEQRAGSL
jgi:formate dehydrogenase major subunit